MDLGDRAFDRELAAFLLEQAGARHQLAFVDLTLRLRRVEQRHRRQHVVADSALGGCLGRRLGVGQRQWRRRNDGARARLRLQRDSLRSGGERRAGSDWLLAGISGQPAAVRLGASLCHFLHRGGIGPGLPRVLGDDLAPLLLALALLVPPAQAGKHLRAAVAGRAEHRRERAPEGELCRDDDRDEEQGKQDDHRPGRAEVRRHLVGQPAAERAAAAVRRHAWCAAAADDHAE